MKRIALFGLVIWQTAAWAAGASSQLPELVSAYRDNSTSAGKAALESYARAHARETSGALAHFALGFASFENKDYAFAVAELTRCRPQLRELADYTSYYLAAAQDALGNPAAAQAEPVLRVSNFVSPLSPLLAKAAIIEAQSMTKLKAPDAEALKATVKVLRDAYPSLPQPEGDFALAVTLDALGEEAEAATFYQRVYFLRPATQAAALSSAAMERLKAVLGQSYPQPPGYQLLERGQQWIAAKEYSKARAEFETIVPLVGGVERDQARVRVGAATYAANDVHGAWQYLRSLQLPHSEADAERDYYLVECSRRMDRDSEMMETIAELARHYERSVWRLKALVSAGNRYLLAHQPEKYEPLYRAAWVGFPSDTATAYCHWKITWDAYLANKQDARSLLREQVERYPADNKAATALYYLGRLAERDRELEEAKAYYTRIADLFPNFYYAVLARERLSQSRVVAAAPSPKASEWLDAVEFPARSDYSSQDPSEATKLRIARARLLAEAGLSDLAESEVRFGAKTDGQTHLLAVELARTDAATYLSLRHMKSLAPDYLSTPIEKAPKPFWRMLFPLPYGGSLVSSANRQNLDPYMVAALIRQESEFNPGAHSHANAYGLTQIVPATGRMLARRQGIRFSPAILYQPETNLRLGTSYLRALLDQWNGRWEETLASYNAGKSRVDEWLSWASYREPSEFVESIPFTETREYVQAIIRNAAIYREIYGPGPPRADEFDARPEPAVRPVKISATVTRKKSHPATHKAAVRHSQTKKQATAAHPHHKSPSKTANKSE